MDELNISMEKEELSKTLKKLEILEIEKDDIVLGFIKEKEIIEGVHLEQLEQLKAKHEKELQAIRQECSKDKEKLLRQIDSQQVSISKHEEKTKEIEKALAQKSKELKETEEGFKKETRKLREEYESVIAHKMVEIEELYRENCILRSKSDPESFEDKTKEDKVIINNYQSKIKALEKDKMEQTIKLEDQFEIEKAEIERKHVREKAEFVKKLASKYDQQNNSSEVENNKYRMACQQEVKEKIEIVEKLWEERNYEDRKQMNARLENEIAIQKKRFSEELRVALLDRDVTIEDLERQKEELLNSIHLERFELAKVYNRELSILNRLDSPTKEDIEVALIDEAAKLRDEQQKVIRNLEKKHKRKMRDLKKSQKPLAEIEEQHKNEIEDLRNKYEMEKEEFEGKLRSEQLNILKSFEFEKNDIERYFKQKIDEREEEFQQEIQGIQFEREMVVEKLTILEEENEELKNEVVKQKERSEEFFDKLQECESRNARLKEEIERENRDKREPVEEKSLIDNGNESIKETVEKLSNLNIQLADELEKERKNCENLLEKVHELEKEHEHLLTEIEDAPLFESELQLSSYPLEEQERSNGKNSNTDTPSVEEKKLDDSEKETKLSKEDFDMQTKLQESLQDYLLEMKMLQNAMDEKEMEIKQLKDTFSKEKCDLNGQIQDLHDALRSALDNNEYGDKDEENVEELQARNKKLRDAMNQLIKDLDDMSNTRGTPRATSPLNILESSSENKVKGFSDEFTALHNLLIDELEPDVKENLGKKIEAIKNHIRRSHALEKLEQQRKHEQEKNRYLKELSGERHKELEVSSEIWNAVCEKLGIDGDESKEKLKAILEEKDAPKESSTPLSETKADDNKTLEYDPEELKRMKEENECLQRELKELEKHYNKEKEELLQKLQTQHKEFVLSSEAEVIEKLLKEKLALEEACNIERFNLSKIYYMEMQDELDEILFQTKEDLKKEHDQDKLNIILKFNKDISDLHKLITDKDENEVELLKEKNALAKKIIDVQRRMPENEKDENNNIIDSDNIKAEADKLEATLPLKKELADLQRHRQEEHEANVQNLEKAIDLINDLLDDKNQAGDSLQRSYSFASVSGRSIESISVDTPRSQGSTSQDQSGLPNEEIRTKEDLQKALQNLIESCLSKEKDETESNTSSGASSDFESETNTPSPEIEEGVSDSGAESIENDCVSIKKTDLELAMNLERFSLGRIYYNEYKDSLKSALQKLSKAKNINQDLEKKLQNGVKDLVNRTNFGKMFLPSVDMETQTMQFDEELKDIQDTLCHEKGTPSHGPSKSSKEDNVDDIVEISDDPVGKSQDISGIEDGVKTVPGAEIEKAKDRLSKNDNTPIDKSPKFSDDITEGRKTDDPVGKSQSISDIDDSPSDGPGKASKEGGVKTIPDTELEAQDRLSDNDDTPLDKSSPKKDESIGAISENLSDDPENMKPVNSDTLIQKVGNKDAITQTDDMQALISPKDQENKENEKKRNRKEDEEHEIYPTDEGSRKNEQTKDHIDDLSEDGERKDICSEFDDTKEKVVEPVYKQESGHMLGLQIPDYFNELKDDEQKHTVDEEKPTYDTQNEAKEDEHTEKEKKSMESDEELTDNDVENPEKKDNEQDGIPGDEEGEVLGQDKKSDAEAIARENENLKDKFNILKSLVGKWFVDEIPDLRCVDKIKETEEEKTPKDISELEDIRKEEKYLADEIKNVEKQMAKLKDMNEVNNKKEEEKLNTQELLLLKKVENVDKALKKEEEKDLTKLLEKEKVEVCKKLEELDIDMKELKSKIPDKEKSIFGSMSKKIELDECVALKARELEKNQKKLSQIKDKKDKREEDVAVQSLNEQKRILEELQKIPLSAKVDEDVLPMTQPTGEEHNGSDISKAQPNDLSCLSQHIKELIKAKRAEYKEDKSLRKKIEKAKRDKERYNRMSKDREERLRPFLKKRKKLQKKLVEKDFPTDESGDHDECLTANATSIERETAPSIKDIEKELVKATDQISVLSKKANIPFDFEAENNAFYMPTSKVKELEYINGQITEKESTIKNIAGNEITEMSELLEEKTELEVKQLEIHEYFPEGYEALQFEVQEAYKCVCLEHEIKGTLHEINEEIKMEEKKFREAVIYQRQGKVSDPHSVIGTILKSKQEMALELQDISNDIPRETDYDTGISEAVRSQYEDKIRRKREIDDSIREMEDSMKSEPTRAAIELGKLIENKQTKTDELLKAADLLKDAKEKLKMTELKEDVLENIPDSVKTVITLEAEVDENIKPSSYLTERENDIKEKCQGIRLLKNENQDTKQKEDELFNVTEREKTDGFQSSMNKDDINSCVFDLPSSSLFAEREANKARIENIERKLEAILSNQNNEKIIKPELNELSSLFHKKAELDKLIKNNQEFGELLNHKRRLAEDLERAISKNEVEAFEQIIKHKEEELDKLKGTTDEVEETIEQLIESQNKNELKNIKLKSDIEEALKETEKMLLDAEKERERYYRSVDKEELSVKEAMSSLEDELEETREEIEFVENELEGLRSYSEDANTVSPELLELTKLLDSHKSLKEYLLEIETKLDNADDYTKTSLSQEEIQVLKAERLDAERKLKDLREQKSKYEVELEDDDIQEAYNSLCEEKSRLKKTRTDVMKKMHGANVLIEMLNELEEDQPSEEEQKYYTHALNQMLSDKKTLIKLAEENEKLKEVACRQRQLLENMNNCISERLGDNLAQGISYGSILDQKPVTRAVIDRINNKDETIEEMLDDLESENKKLNNLNEELSSELDFLREKIGESLFDAILQANNELSDDNLISSICEIPNDDKTVEEILEKQNDALGRLKDIIGETLIGTLLKPNTDTSAMEESEVFLKAPKIMRETDDDLETVIEAYELGLDNFGRENDHLKNMLGDGLVHALLDFDKDGKYIQLPEFESVAAQIGKGYLKARSPRQGKECDSEEPLYPLDNYRSKADQNLESEGSKRLSPKLKPQRAPKNLEEGEKLEYKPKETEERILHRQQEAPVESKGKSIEIPESSQKAMLELSVKKYGFVAPALMVEDSKTLGDIVKGYENDLDTLKVRLGPGLYKEILDAEIEDINGDNMNIITTDDEKKYNKGPVEFDKELIDKLQKDYIDDTSHDANAKEDNKHNSDEGNNEEKDLASKINEDEDEDEEKQLKKQKPILAAPKTMIQYNQTLEKVIEGYENDLEILKSRLGPELYKHILDAGKPVVPCETEAEPEETERSEQVVAKLEHKMENKSTVVEIKSPGAVEKRDSGVKAQKPFLVAPITKMIEENQTVEGVIEDYVNGMEILKSRLGPELYENILDTERKYYTPRESGRKPEEAQGDEYLPVPEEDLQLRETEEKEAIAHDSTVEGESDSLSGKSIENNDEVKSQGDSPEQVPRKASVEEYGNISIKPDGDVDINDISMLKARTKKDEEAPTPREDHTIKKDDDSEKPALVLNAPIKMSTENQTLGEVIEDYEKDLEALRSRLGPELYKDILNVDKQYAAPGEIENTAGETQGEMYTSASDKDQQLQDTLHSQRSYSKEEKGLPSFEANIEEDLDRGKITVNEDEKGQGQYTGTVEKRSTREDKSCRDSVVGALEEGDIEGEEKATSIINQKVNRSGHTPSLNAPTKMIKENKTLAEVIEGYENKLEILKSRLGPELYEDILDPGKQYAETELKSGEFSKDALTLGLEEEVNAVNISRGTKEDKSTNHDTTEGKTKTREKSGIQRNKQALAIEADYQDEGRQAEIEKHRSILPDGFEDTGKLIKDEPPLLTEIDDRIIDSCSIDHPEEGTQEDSRENDQAKDSESNLSEGETYLSEGEVYETFNAPTNAKESQKSHLLDDKSKFSAPMLMAQQGKTLGEVLEIYESDLGALKSKLGPKLFEHLLVLGKEGYGDDTGVAKKPCSTELNENLQEKLADMYPEKQRTESLSQQAGSEYDDKLRKEEINEKLAEGMDVERAPTSTIFNIPDSDSEFDLEAPKQMITQNITLGEVIQVYEEDLKTLKKSLGPQLCDAILKERKQIYESGNAKETIPVKKEFGRQDLDYVELSRDEKDDKEEKADKWKEVEQGGEIRINASDEEIKEDEYYNLSETKTRKLEAPLMIAQGKRLEEIIDDYEKVLDVMKSRIGPDLYNDIVKAGTPDVLEEREAKYLTTQKKGYESIELQSKECIDEEGEGPSKTISQENEKETVKELLIEDSEGIDNEKRKKQENENDDMDTNTDNVKETAVKQMIEQNKTLQEVVQCYEKDLETLNSKLGPELFKVVLEAGCKQDVERDTPINGKDRQLDAELSQTPKIETNITNVEPIRAQSGTQVKQGRNNTDDEKFLGDIYSAVKQEGEHLGLRKDADQEEKRQGSLSSTIISKDVEEAKTPSKINKNYEPLLLAEKETTLQDVIEKYEEDLNTLKFRLGPNLAKALLKAGEKKAILDEKMQDFQPSNEVETESITEENAKEKKVELNEADVTRAATKEVMHPVTKKKENKQPEMDNYSEMFESNRTLEDVIKNLKSESDKLKVKLGPNLTDILLGEEPIERMEKKEKSSGDEYKDMEKPFAISRVQKEIVNARKEKEKALDEKEKKTEIKDTEEVKDASEKKNILEHDANASGLYPKQCMAPKLMEAQKAPLEDVIQDYEHDLAVFKKALGPNLVNILLNDKKTPSTDNVPNLCDISKKDKVQTMGNIKSKEDPLVLESGGYDANEIAKNTEEQIITDEDKKDKTRKGLETKQSDIQKSKELENIIYPSLIRDEDKNLENILTQMHSELDEVTSGLNVLENCIGRKLYNELCEFKNQKDKSRGQDQGSPENSSVPPNKEHIVKSKFDAVNKMADEEKSLEVVIQDYEKVFGQLERENQSLKKSLEGVSGDDGVDLGDIISKYESQITMLESAKKEEEKKFEDKHNELQNEIDDLRSTLERLAQTLRQDFLEDLMSQEDSDNRLEALQIMEKEKKTLAEVVEEYEENIKRLEREKGVLQKLAGQGAEGTSMLDTVNDYENAIQGLKEVNKVLSNRIDKLTDKLGHQLTEQIMNLCDTERKTSKIDDELKGETKPMNAVKEMEDKNLTLEELLKIYDDNNKREFASFDNTDQLKISDKESVEGVIATHDKEKQMDNSNQKVFKDSEVENKENQYKPDSTCTSKKEGYDTQNASEIMPEVLYERIGKQLVNDINSLDNKSCEELEKEDKRPLALRTMKARNEKLEDVIKSYEQTLSEHGLLGNSKLMDESLASETMKMLEDKVIVEGTAHQYDATQTGLLDNGNLMDASSVSELQDAIGEKIMMEETGHLDGTTKSRHLEECKNEEGNDDNDDKETQLKNIKQQLEEEKTLKEKYQKDVEDLLNDIVKIKMKNASGNEGKEDIANQLKEEYEQKLENKELKEDLSKEKDTNKDLVNENNELKSEIQNMKKEIKGLDKALEKMQANASILNDEDDRDASEGKLKELLLKNKKLEKELEGLKTQLKEHEEFYKIGKKQSEQDLKELWRNNDGDSSVDKNAKGNDDRLVQLKMRNESLKEQLDLSEEAMKNALQKYQDEIKSLEIEKTKLEDDKNYEIELLKNKLGLEKAALERLKNDYDEMIKREKEKLTEDFDKDLERERRRFHKDLEEQAKEFEKHQNLHKQMLQDLNEKAEKEKAELNNVFQEEKEKLQKMLEEKMRQKDEDNQKIMDEFREKAEDQMITQKAEMNIQFKQEKTELKHEIEKNIYGEEIQKNLDLEKDFQEMLNKVLKDHGNEVAKIERAMIEAEERFKEQKIQLLEEFENEKANDAKQRERERQEMDSTIENLLKEIIKLKHQRKEMRQQYRVEKLNIEELSEKERIEIQENLQRSKDELVTKLKEDHKKQIESENEKYDAIVKELREALDRSETKRKDLEEKLRTESLRAEASSLNNKSMSEKPSEDMTREVKVIKRRIEIEYDQKLNIEKQRFEDTLQGLRREVGNLQEKRKIIQERVYNQESPSSERHIIEKSIANYKLEVLTKLEGEMAQRIERERKPLEEEIRELQIENEELKRQRWEMKTQFRREKAALEEELEREKEILENNLNKEKEELRKRLETKLQKEKLNKVYDHKVSPSPSPVLGEHSPRIDNTVRMLKQENLSLVSQNARNETDIQQLTEKLNFMEMSYKEMMETEKIKGEKMKKIQEQIAKMGTLAPTLPAPEYKQPSSAIQDDAILQNLQNKDQQIHELLETKRYYESVLGELCEEASLFELDRNQVV